jgi:D-arabinose 1-dehydrogenase-like Zn-dependent alcohol dehydrogenase
MASFGTIYPLTISGGNINFPYLPLVLKELKIVGSCASSMVEVNKMFQFIVAHKIKPVVQKFPMSVAGITDAFGKLGRGEIRYRGVLEV